MNTKVHPLRRVVSSSLPLLAVASVLWLPAQGRSQLLLDGDFDQLTVGTAPDRGVPNGAWSFPDAYCCTSGGDALEPSNRKEIIGVVETSSFDPTRTGLSLELNDNRRDSPFVALPNFFTDVVRQTDGGLLRINFDVYVPTSEGRTGGGRVFLSSDPVGFGGLSAWTDTGPALEWRASNSITVAECNSFVIDCRNAGYSRSRIMTDYPRDVWQHVQLDIDLVADKYDVFWAAGEDSLQEIATDLDFVSGRKSELDRLHIANFPSESNRMFVDNVSATWLPPTPYSTISLSGADGSYVQDFDAAFGVDGSVTNQPLPVGWTGSRNGIFTSDSITKAFPATSVTAGNNLYNAGADQSTDRALAIGLGNDSSRGTLQLLADVTDADADQLQLAFDIEAWDASTASSTTNPGTAAFDVSVEIDQGSGFEPLLDLGRVTTGATLQKPTGPYLDGNDPLNRVSFDSGLLPTNIPAGSRLRVRWAADSSISQRWIFGLDNVTLNLLGSGIVLGDFNGDGMLGIDDLNQLSSEIAMGNVDPQYDLDQSGTVDLGDRSFWVTELKRTWMGDANLDGNFNSTDMVDVFLAGEYEDAVDGNSDWNEGDWDGDGDFSSTDLVQAFLDGGYEQGTRAAVSAVPEPSSVLLLALGALWSAATRRRFHSLKTSLGRAV